MHRALRLLRAWPSRAQARSCTKSASSVLHAKWATGNSDGEHPSNAPTFNEPHAQPQVKSGANARGLDALQGLSLPSEPNTQRIVIDAIGDASFTISGVRVRGSVLLLPHLATFWNVESVAEVTPDAFAVLKLHHPRPDMLLLGTGAKVQRVSPEVHKFLRDMNVGFDVYDTKNACHVFNVLNSEGRFAAAALLPATLQGLAS